MLGFMANAIVAALQFSTDAESLKIFYSWSAGSFSFVTWPQIIIMAAAICTGCAAALVNMKGLDILLFGDEFAAAAGADPRHIRLLAMFSCCLCTGAVTAFCGPIGFAGIVAPHIAKWATGSSSHRSTIAGAMLCGSIICLGRRPFVTNVRDSPSRVRHNGLHRHPAHIIHIAKKAGTMTTWKI